MIKVVVVVVVVVVAPTSPVEVGGTLPCGGEGRGVKPTSCCCCCCCGCGCGGCERGRGGGGREGEEEFSILRVDNSSPSPKARLTTPPSSTSKPLTAGFFRLQNVEC